METIVERIRRICKWSEATTMREGGWSNPDTVHRIYTHLANQDANEDVKRMQDFFASG
jgi:hypothetical protein